MMLMLNSLWPKNVRKILQIGVHDLETLIEYINAGTFNDETLKQMLDMADELFGLMR